MKIIHIVTSDYTGAGLCAKRICKAQIALGINAKLLVLEKTCNDTYIISYPQSPWIHIRKYWIKILRRLHLYKLCRELSFEHLMQHYHFWGSLPLSPYRIHSHPLVKEADIIHLHYIDSFLDYPSFFRHVQKKIIWTQHDESINFGISHYMSAYQALPYKIKLLDKYYKTIKQKAILQIKNLTLISLSQMMYEFNRSNAFTQNLRDIIINNSVDYNDFQPIDKKNARIQLNLPLNKILLLFVAADISDERKGLRDLVKAVQMMNNSELKICTVGLNNHKADDISGLIRFGTIKNCKQLSIIYSAADYFVMPSLQEAFAQTPLEAMACGKPVIAYPCSGIRELLNKNNGIVCDDFSIKSLVKALTIAMKTQYNALSIRKYIIQHYSPAQIAQQYLETYQNN